MADPQGSIILIEIFNKRIEKVTVIFLKAFANAKFEILSTVPCKKLVFLPLYEVKLGLFERV